MESTKRALTNLLNLDRRVYIYFADTAVWDIFVKQAAAEGFLRISGEKITKDHYDNIIALNNNMTFNYIGWVGRMRFSCADNNLYRIDYAKYINGEENYCFRK